MLRSLEQQTESHEKAPGSPSGRHFHLPLYAACLGLLVMAASLQGCSSNAPKAGADAPQKPAIPEEVLDATKSLLGSAAQVLLYGDLAKTGKQQLLAANVVPNTPKSTVAGLVVTRAVIAENEDGKWVELVRCDEHLKNAKGYLALTPLQAVSGWRLQYENSAEQGLSLYLTPVQAGTSGRTLPVAVRWNPETKRYQSMDYSYTHFLSESPTLESPRSSLR
ncbi:MAG TPA: hypothetical protein VJY15_21880 [Candidatus Acidoferrum sp.]|nr:hypothetical protein [Candidatus Acidoferrum sp.]